MNYNVRMRCTVIKELTCMECTEAEARENPFAFASSETEVELAMEDWEVLEVEADEPEETT